MIEYHADDFGLFPAQSQRIIDCYRMGVLNGISVITNSLFFHQCMEMLVPYQADLKIAVHLNFMEGHCVCEQKEVDCLVNKQGNFNVTFGKLLFVSLLPRKKRYRQQLRKEISAQIHMLLQYLPDKSLRIDSHAHYHMIPIVFDALMDVIREENLSVSYIRIPKENIRNYIRCKKKLLGFLPINFLKVIILNFLAKWNLYKYPNLINQLEQSVFMGVMYSGRMCTQNILALLPEAISLAESQRYNIEILAHPGGVYEEENIKQLTNKIGRAHV